MPTASEEVVSEAAPVESSGTVPMLEPPSLNVTMPVGVPAVELTVAVNVTAWPKMEEIFEDVRVVEDWAIVTVKVAAFDMRVPDELVKAAR